MLECLREDITSGGCLSKQIPNKIDSNHLFYFFFKDAILEEIKRQRK